MNDRRYYSIRTGNHPVGPQLDLPLMLTLFENLYHDLNENGYFQEAFGYYCVDAGDVPGKIGANINAHFVLKLRKDNLWPIFKQFRLYDESDLFDVIELLYDNVSKPLSGMHHTYGGCGWHYRTFDKKPGQIYYRARIDELLKDYREGYELSREGEILRLAIPGAESLLNDKLPEYDTNNVESIVDEAINCFKRARSSLTDKANSVKMLSGVLEFLRPQIKTALTSADEKDLFNIANNFGVRHHNEKQKTDFDQDIWLDFIFYYYLAAIKATVRIIKKRENNV